MKYSAVFGAAALAFGANDAEAFFMPTGAVTSGASSTSPLSSTSTSKQSVAAHSAGCSCFSCAPRVHGKSCTCPSCSSAAVSGRSHGSSCRCGACSVRMQAHPEGCGCGDCPTTVGAFHGVSCKCPACASPEHGGSCMCGACACIGKGRRAASSLTVMSMGNHQMSELGEAATAFGQRLVDEPESVVFDDTMAAIAESFDYAPKRFVNGVTSSDSGANEGSCKVFSYGKIAGLSPAETLACFGEHYRSVAADPSGDSHGNIRAFMESGWEGVSFPDGLCLSMKKD